MGKPSGRVKLLILGVGIIALSAIGLLVSTIILGVRLKNKADELNALKSGKEDVCITPECAKAAGAMLQAMDFSVDPCEDFYHFSCGGWIYRNPIPDTSSTWNQFNIPREQLSRDVRSILEYPIDNEMDPNPLIMAKKFYKSCMGQNSTNESELRDLIELTLNVTEAKNNLGLKLAELRRVIGGPLLANLYVELDQKNASNYIIYLDQPGLGINRAFLVNATHPTRQAYREVIEEAWPLVYPDSDGVIFSKIADDVLSFETKIAEICTPPEKRRNRTELYNLMTLQELNKHTTDATMINWLEYIPEVFKDVMKDHGIEFKHLPNTTLVLRDKSYFSELGRVIKNESMSVIVNYMRWRLILGLGSESSEKIREVFFQFNKKTQGTLYPPPKWKICSDKTNGFMGMAVSYNYVQAAFSGDFEKQMKEMITNIQDAMFASIDTVEWIADSKTREKAKAKAKQMKEFIGYPDWLLTNSTALDAYYEGLSLTKPESHLQNVLDFAFWSNKEGLRKIKEKKDPNKWITFSTIVNAYYSATYNSISFPAGILQPPFYFTGKPIQALNYGAIGMVIGHEIIHGFDDRGRQSDGNGNLINWWDQGTVDNYVKRAKCFIDQYGQYSAEEANNTRLNGNNTLGENIADNGGLRQSFNAYKSFTRLYGKEPRLPGLEFSPEQLFFIAFSQIWCGSFTPQGMENQILTGAHSPNRFRVRGALQNSPEFASTWNCSVPTESQICKIW